MLNPFITAVHSAAVVLLNRWYTRGVLGMPAKSGAGNEKINYVTCHAFFLCKIINIP